MNSKIIKLIQVLFIFLIFHDQYVISEYDKNEKYCDFEKEINTLHVGCPKNWNFFQTLPYHGLNITIGELNINIKEKFLDFFNKLKNEFASGEYENKGFPSGSNFTVIQYNDELEYLANISLKYLPFEIDAGAEISLDEAVFSVIYIDLNNTDIEIFFNESLLYFSDEIYKKDYKWMANYYAESNKVGCAFSSSEEFDENSKKFIPAKTIRCLFSTILEDRDSYATGIPCSECNTTCSKIYTSLCE